MFARLGGRLQRGGETLAAQRLSDAGDPLVGRDLYEKPVPPAGVDDERLYVSDSHTDTGSEKRLKTVSGPDFRPASGVTLDAVGSRTPPLHSYGCNIR